MQKNILEVFPKDSSPYVIFIPRSLTFGNAYEGKKIYRTLEVQNCHFKPIEVRFGKPSSNTLSVKTSKKVFQLSLGLKCSCKLEYQHSSVREVSQIFLPIYVNNEIIDYKITVITSFANLILEPCDLDFGKINMDQTNKRLSVTLRNNGCRNTLYLVDLGKNDTDIAVLPERGIIEVKNEVILNIYVLNCKEGLYEKEIWIKCDVPQRLRIFGEFITPKLIINNPLTNRYFTLIDFSIAYYGQEVKKYITVQNYSSEQTMFCIMVDKDFFVDVRKRDNTFRSFNINPYEGRIAAHQNVVLEFSFKPIKRTLSTRSEYFAGVVKICKVGFTDIIDRPQEEKQDSLIGSESMSALYSVLGNQNMLQNEFKDEFLIQNSYLNIFLHGEAESSNVTIAPIDRSIIKGTIGEKIEKNVIITNESTKLPIIVESVRLSGVKALPPKFRLEPEESRELFLNITPNQMKLSGYLKFRLLNINTVVGESKYPINYEANVRKIISTKTPIVALENTQKEEGEVCLSCKKIRYKYFVPSGTLTRSRCFCRPKTPAVECITFVSTTPRFQNSFKKKYSSYYLRYLRKNARIKSPKCKVSRNLDAYVFNKINKPLQSCSDCKSFVLSPMQLAKIKVTPKQLLMTNIDPDIAVRVFFTIYNGNEFEILVKLQSLDFQVKAERLGSYVIAGNSSEQIGMIFEGTCIGKQIITIDCILNDSHVYNLWLIVIVVPNKIHVDRQEVLVNCCDRSKNYLELKNNFNSPIYFKWDIEEPIFEIFPSEGCIPAKQSILCGIEYLKKPKISDRTIANLYSETGLQRSIRLTHQNKTINVGVDNKVIDFGNLPLNILKTEYFTIRNLSDVFASFVVNTPTPLFGINVKPLTGIIPRKGDQIFEINAVITDAIKFKCIVSVTIERLGDIDIDVKGTCILPVFTITPNNINFRKIMPYSAQANKFIIENTSDSKMDLEFHFIENFSDFFVCNSLNGFDKVTKFSLAKSEKRPLYLHFQPMEVNSTAFLLPLMANKIIGPPTMNDSKTMLYEYFINSKYKDHANVQVTGKPKHIEMLRITSVVTKKYLTFSNFFMNFSFHHDTYYKTKNFSTFEVSNLTKDKEMQICIRTDELDHPFSFTYLEGADVSLHNKSIHCKLLPGEIVIFSVKFQPEVKEFGTFFVRLPIYLKDYYERKPFNMIKLKGTYPKPTINTNIIENAIYYHSTVMRQPSEIIIQLDMNYHFGKCFISEKCPREMKCFYENGRQVKNGKHSIIVNLKIIPILDGEMHKMLDFECSCAQIKCSFTIHGCFENCMPTAYSNFFRVIYGILGKNFSIEDKNALSSSKSVTTVDSSGLDATFLNDTCFPLFPLDTDNSHYAIFMRRIHLVVESWLNTQALFNSRYRSIPVGISKRPIEVTLFSDGSKSSDTLIPVLAQVLINFGGLEAKQYVCSMFRPAPKELDNVVILSKTYMLCLEYIKALGGLLPHVSSEYLLCYQDFLVYREFNATEIDEKKFEQYFYRRSKQCYIDVLIQVYKIFVLENIILLDKRSFHNIKIEDPQLAWYSPNEHYLLRWSERQYNTHKTFWNYTPKNKVDFTPKRFDNFNNDFTDSLAIAAILITYCPFVKDNLKNMYSQPANVAELFHNANTVCRVYQSLRLSLDISPYNIVNSNFLEILILINYLHDIIPHYTPNETVTLKANLGTTSKWNILVENHENRTIRYHVMFFGNESQRFSAESRYLAVSPRSSEALEISFHAKTIDYCTATIILCGEFAGFKYSKTLVTTLIGQPLVTDIPDVIQAQLNVFEVVSKRIRFSGKDAGIYEIFYLNNDGEVPELIKYQNDLDLDVPNFVYFNSDKFEIDSEGCIAREFIYCCPTNIVVSQTLYAKHPQVQHFVFLLKMVGTYDDRLMEHLTHNLPTNFKNFTCICKKSKNKFSLACSRTLNIKIPRRNNIFFNAFVKYLFEILHPTEINFCKNIMKQPVFTRIFKYFMKKRHETTNNFRLFDIYFSDFVTYKVHIVNINKVRTINSLKIPNVYDAGFEYLPVHISRGMNLHKDVRISLTSQELGGAELRIYSIKFCET